MDNQVSKDVAMRISIRSIVTNVGLATFMLLTGIFTHSAAIMSESVNTASDVISTFVVMIGVKLSGKKADKEHPYGHERLECVAAILLAVILLATGLGIGYDGVQKVLRGVQGDLEAPGAFALVAACVSIGVKEWMFWYTRKAAKTIHSSALMADAWHHRSDSLSSLSSLIGVAGARIGFAVLDPVACIIVCFFITKTAYDIFMDAIRKMSDVACDDETIAKMRDIINAQEGVTRLDEIKTRLFGDKIYVDIEVGVEHDTHLDQAHEIADRVHDGIEHAFANVKHCMVHVNPTDKHEAE